jgi:hypothetical protein
VRARWLIVVVGLALGFACSGRQEVCYDCDCGPGPFSVTGTVTRADRADLVGAKLDIWPGGLTLTGPSWTARYDAREVAP